MEIAPGGCLSRDFTDSLPQCCYISRVAYYLPTKNFNWVDIPPTKNVIMEWQAVGEIRQSLSRNGREFLLMLYICCFSPVATSVMFASDICHVFLPVVTGVMLAQWLLIDILARGHGRILAIRARKIFNRRFSAVMDRDSRKGSMEFMLNICPNGGHGVCAARLQLPRFRRFSG